MTEEQCKLGAELLFQYSLLLGVKSYEFLEEFREVKKFVPDPRMLGYFMVVAAFFACVSNYDIPDEDEYDAFCKAAWSRLDNFDFGGYSPVKEMDVLMALRSLADFSKDYRTSPTDYFWSLGYWVACNIKREALSKKEMKAANLISGFLKVAISDWFADELLGWLSLFSDEPNVYRSPWVKAEMNRIESGTTYPESLPKKERERVIRDDQLSFVSTVKLIHENSTHPQAKKLLLECLKEDKSYALFLRNFGVEAAQMHAEGEAFGGPQMVTALKPNSKNEDQINTRVSQRMPIVGIDNAIDIYPERRSIPRLEVWDEHWLLVMLMMAERARIIVIAFSRFTEGLSDELLLLNALGRKDSTIIIVDLKPTFGAFTMAGQIAKVADPEPLEWSEASEKLSPYGTVIRDDEIETRLSEILAQMLADKSQDCNNIDAQ
ncbi:MAG: hypothetical protein WA584_16900 [Pyrinomonadaceae bacterium]